MSINIENLSITRSCLKSSICNSDRLNGEEGGVSITSIEKIKTEGLIDTYQINFSNGDKFNFQIKNGKDGVTPYIGDNGNWWIDGIDTGTKAGIDSLEHVNEESGIEDTPIGHIITHMGTIAPKHYLICDGSEYNIEDYPTLVKHFIDNFGKANYFGGDGEATFAVPDLRGEFLRGSGTATRNTGSGADVGVHQQATIHRELYTDLSLRRVQFAENVKCNAWNSTAYTDTHVYNKRYSMISEGLLSTPTTDPNSYSGYTSRPTNTSVLYCIKYEPTYYIKNTYNVNNLYSTDEAIIGKWIDGKTLYQKVIVSKIEDSIIRISHGIENLGSFVSIKGFAENGGYSAELPIIGDAMDGLTKVVYKNEFDKIEIYNTNPNFAESKLYITVQYTKTSDSVN